MTAATLSRPRVDLFVNYSALCDPVYHHQQPRPHRHALMMLITLAARLICNVCCFLYPAYASYKALTYPNPVQDPSGNGGVERSGVERWLMYWAVVGTWTAVEAVAGWTFTWLPFYSIFKTIIFLYLSLPQSEGSTYLYYNHLAPLFNEHERDIDSFLASLRSRASVALVGGAEWLWDKLRSQLAVSASSSSKDPSQPYYTTDGSEGSAQFPNGTIQPPSLQDPASGAALQLYGFLSRKASTLLPVALTGLQAAWERGQGSRAGGTGPLSGILREAGVGARHETTSEGYNVEYASTIQETIAMPIPRVAPSNENLRSRTFQHGQESLGVTSSHKYSFGSLGTPGSHGRTPSGASQSLPTRGASNRHSSEESLGSRRSSRGDMGSYEDINRAEVLAEEEQQRANAAAAGRPGLPKKRSGSWFGWSAGSGGSGSPDRPKVD